MKELPVRRFTTVVDYLVEDTLITKDGRPIGVYTPMEVLDRIAKEASVDDIARKAIEPEKVKLTDGKPSKGLGQLPGQLPPQPIRYTEFRPAPKPGSKK